MEQAIVSIAAKLSSQKTAKFEIPARMEPVIADELGVESCQRRTGVGFRARQEKGTEQVLGFSARRGPRKEAYWEKWIGLYNAKLLSRGTFHNLYVYGYDVPEGYAIETNGEMYDAFFAPQTESGSHQGEPAAWSGEIELRGLAPGKYHVVDYVDGTDLGVVTAPDAKLTASFADHLLIEVTKQ